MMILQADTSCTQEENLAMQQQAQLVRSRRLKARPVNGSAELYLPSDKPHPLQTKLIGIMDDIENAELQIAELAETGKHSIEESRKRRLLQNELKLRINRLTEEYEEIVKVLPLE